MACKVMDALGGSDAARDRPAGAIALALIDNGITVTAFDLAGMELAKLLMPEVRTCNRAPTPRSTSAR